MAVELVDHVRAVLLPAVEPLGLAITDHQESAAFGNALVTLRSEHLRVRVVRDRGQVLVHFGSATAPDVWVDSQLVSEMLGLGAGGGFHDRNTVESLEALGSFLRSFAVELQHLFAPEAFASTRERLKQLGDNRAERMFGPG